MLFEHLKLRNCLKLTSEVGGVIQELADAIPYREIGFRCVVSCVAFVRDVSCVRPTDRQINRAGEGSVRLW